MAGSRAVGASGRRTVHGGPQAVYAVAAQPVHGCAPTAGRADTAYDDGVLRITRPAGALVLTSEVNLSNRGALRTALIEQAQRCGSDDLVVEVAALRYWDACSIRPLAERAMRSPPGASLVLMGSGPALRRLIQLCRLHELPRLSIGAAAEAR
ncbi:MAG: hypothetical protein JO309_06420 [Pseudonocardiales bacterium]|nr:hypothetical protein [Pseudonocardiales bacterium]MBV9729032.1 hypothetical protein [Pseudonocardiales bacterium]